MVHFLLNRVWAIGDESKFLKSLKRAEKYIKSPKNGSNRGLVFKSITTGFNSINQFGLKGAFPEKVSENNKL